MRRTFFELDDSESSEEEEDLVRLFVLGPAKVGKSMFIHRLVHNHFSLYYTPTRALEIYKPVQIGTRRYQLWDVPENVDISDYLAPHAVVLMCTDDFSLSKVKLIYEKAFKSMQPEVWVVVQNMGTLRKVLSVDICPKERVFTVNNCSTDGIGDLMYDIEQAI